LVQAIFYADDGYIYSYDADALQRATDLIVELFECMGLATNPNKTKVMIYAPQPAPTQICTPAYKRKMGELDTDTYTTRKRRLIECEICNATVQERSLNRHKLFKHGSDILNTNIQQQTTPPHLSENGNVYEISMPEYKQLGECPVPGCNTII
jgi:hypothetical protein